MPSQVPAPWSLRGRGYVFAYRFPEAFARAQAPEALEAAYRGGPGAVMLVDYTESPVGPYRELLFLAGRFTVGASTAFSIPRILVSSEASMRAGRANWGLPKELAAFEWQEAGRRRERVCVSNAGGVLFEAVLEHGVVPFPVWCPAWPALFTLAQPWDGRLLVTTLRGAGFARRARLRSLRLDEARFPGVGAFRPWVGFAMAPFRLNFPVPHEVGLRS